MICWLHFSVHFHAPWILCLCTGITRIPYVTFYKNVSIISVVCKVSTTIYHLLFVLYHSKKEQWWNHKRKSKLEKRRKTIKDPNQSGKKVCVYIYICIYKWVFSINIHGLWISFWGSSLLLKSDIYSQHRYASDWIVRNLTICRWHEYQNNALILSKSMIYSKLWRSLILCSIFGNFCIVSLKRLKRTSMREKRTKY